ncbi:hypothetical protein ANN_05189, partial [Periplaneta americana]
SGPFRTLIKSQQSVFHVPSYEQAPPRKGRRAGTSNTSIGAFPPSPERDDIGSTDDIMDSPVSNSAHSGILNSPSKGLESAGPIPPPRSRRTGGWADEAIKSGKERFRGPDHSKGDSDDDIPVIPDLDDMQDEELASQIAHAPSLTGQAYTNFLENTIPHVLEDTPLINRQHIHFLHDGAPAHLSRTARRYLDRRLPDRWIGRGGPIAWPPRSPDLNPLDFYLWGHLKSLVHSSLVPDLESLRNRIVACSEDLRNTPGVWDRLRRVSVNRADTYKELDSDLFKHSAFATLDDVNLRLLTKCLNLETDIKEPDTAWTWDLLFTDVASELHYEWENQTRANSEKDMAVVST